MDRAKCERGRKIKRLKKAFPKENRKWSWKLGTSALNSVNVSQSNPDIFGIESGTADGSDLSIRGTLAT